MVNVEVRKNKEGYELNLKTLIYVLDDTQQHLIKRLRRAGPTIYQTTGNRMCPRQYQAARDITGTKTRASQHR